MVDTSLLRTIEYTDREYSNGVLRVSILSRFLSATAFADKDSRHTRSSDTHDSCEFPHMSFVRTRTSAKIIADVMSLLPIAVWAKVITNPRLSFF
jgi:hypothetical protein